MKTSKQEIFFKELMPAAKQLAKRGNTTKNNTTSFIAQNNMLLNRYGEKKTVVRKSVCNLVKHVPTCFVSIAMCIVRAILKF